MNKRVNILLLLLTLVIIAILLFSFTEDGEEQKENAKEDTNLPMENLDEQDIYNYLPLTTTMTERDKELTIVAYRLWFDHMGKLREEGKIRSFSQIRFHLLKDGEKEFEVVVVFGVGLGPNIQETTLGMTNENNFVEDIVWRMKIKHVEGLTYTLESIEKETDKFIGLPPVQDMDEYMKEAGLEKTNENYRYEIIDHTLRVTYNNGNDWVEVPVKVEDLFEGDYTGTT
jgi:hypothetical protein